MYDMPYHENNIHVALTFGDAFTLEAANANDTLEWVKSLDFFRHLSTFTIRPPSTTPISCCPRAPKFECEEDASSCVRAMATSCWRNGMIRPLFESKSDLQIERLLAAQWGLEKLLPESYEELARYSLEGVDELDPSMKGITYDALLRTAAVCR